MNFWKADNERKKQIITSTRPVSFAASENDGQLSGGTKNTVLPCFFPRLVEWVEGCAESREAEHVPQIEKTSSISSDLKPDFLTKFA